MAAVPSPKCRGAYGLITPVPESERAAAGFSAVPPSRPSCRERGRLPLPPDPRGAAPIDDDLPVAAVLAVRASGHPGVSHDRARPLGRVAPAARPEDGYDERGQQGGGAGRRFVGRASGRGAEAFHPPRELGNLRPQATWATGAAPAARVAGGPGWDATEAGGRRRAGRGARPHRASLRGQHRAVEAAEVRQGVGDRSKVVPH